jgi:hypothetical protein
MSSDDRKLVDSFLAEIGAAVGKNIRLNENGISAFTYDHLTFVVEVPDNVSSFFIYTTLLSLGRCNNPLVITKKLLQLNYLQQETRGGCIGIDSTNDDVIFSYSDRINEINGTEFRNILENFIDTSLQLCKQLDEAEAHQPGSSASGEQMMAQQMSQQGLNGSIARQLNQNKPVAPVAPSSRPVADLNKPFRPPVDRAIMP